MTKEKFAEMTKGAELSDQEVAVLRKDLSLPYDKKAGDHQPVFHRYLLQGAILKLPKPVST